MSLSRSVPSLLTFSRSRAPHAFAESRLLHFADGGGQAGAGDGGGSSGDGGGGDGKGSGSSSDNGGKGQGGDDGKGKGDGKTPDPVPYDRFKEVNDQLAAAKEREQKRAKEDDEARQKKLQEDGKFQDIIKELTPQAERAKALEKTLETYLDAEMKDIPEARRSLIPEGLSVEQKLEYIAKNRKLLHGDGKRNVNTSTSPGEGSDGGEPTTFTLEQLQDPVFYDKNRDAILKAQREGRIK